LTIALQHDKCSILIRKPAESGERYHAVRANHDESPKTMINAWQPGLAAIRTDAVF
jgi:hypothetical protein